jgi:hypothetical protein
MNAHCPFWRGVRKLAGNVASLVCAILFATCILWLMKGELPLQGEVALALACLAYMRARDAEKKSERAGG